MPGKNVRVLAGHPLLAYSIATALDSAIFASVIVSTDSEETAAIARHYGAEVPFLRPAEMAADLSPDIGMGYDVSRTAASVQAGRVNQDPVNGDADQFQPAIA